VHRIGRTARAGATGIAISFCDAEERPFLRDIEKLIRMSIPATDRRGHRSPEPQANGAEASQRQAPHHRERRERHNGHQPDRQAHDRQAHGHKRGGKPHRGGKPQHQQRNGQKPQNGHSQKQRTSHQQRREQPRGSDGTIASVGFLQQKPRQDRHPGGSGTRPLPR
jgi:ATP-dependent RNA helicase RhlE